jgi:hypothetical protein
LHTERALSYPTASGRGAHDSACHQHRYTRAVAQCLA